MNPSLYFALEASVLAGIGVLLGLKLKELLNNDEKRLVKIPVRSKDKK